MHEAICDRFGGVASSTEKIDEEAIDDNIHGGFGEAERT